MSNLQFTMLLGTGITLLFIILMSIKSKMNTKYTVAWIIWGGIMLLFSIFPQLIDDLSVMLSIATPVNTVFLIFIFLIYVMSFYLFMKVSDQDNKIKTLTYEVANLKRLIEDKHE